MADILDLNKNTPAKPANESGAEPTRTKEEELVHRRVEREAMKGAKRAGEREIKNEEGHDQFSDIAPV